MRTDTDMLGDVGPVGLSRFAVAVAAFAALTLYGSVGFAEDEEGAAAEVPVTASEASASSAADEHPHMSTSIQLSADALAAKLANPTAPVMALNSYLDTTVWGGTLPGAKKGTFTYSFQPAFPFKFKPFNMIFRPLIPIQFGQPYVDGTGTVDQAVGFGNISLDSVLAKTFKNGFMLMGGLSTLFPTDTKSELRAAWALGPELLLGYASKKFVGGAIVAYNFDLPQGSRGQTVSGQYFYAYTLGNGWQIAAQPTFSYRLDTKVTTFPIGLGFKKTTAIGKRKQPIQFGAQIWGYAAQNDALGQSWQLRFNITPVVPAPWTTPATRTPPAPPGGA